MRIAICTTQVPFVSGGAELHARNLKAALLEYGHEADIVSIPFKWYPPAELLQSMLLWRLVDLEEAAGKTIDRVIALKFPAYLVQHHNKVLWIIHQHRQAYDLWGTDLCDLRQYAEGARVRDIIIDTDNRVLREAIHVFANSRTVAQRLKTYNNVDATPLYHPPPHTDPITVRSYGDYIFYPSRLDSMKRQILLIEAMSYVKTNAKCILAGRGPDEPMLRAAIQSRHLGERVRLLGFIGDDELARYYAGALAVFYGPINEDYGYVTLEAFLAGKAVVTLRDSGGPLEFVEDGINAFVASPDPEDIAHKIDILFQDRQRAQDLGEHGFAMLAERRISWANVVRRLTS